MRAVETLLSTPPIERVVPASVFDAFGWCESDTLLWRRPPERWDPDTPVDGTDPARMVFVMHVPLDFLPHELAALHALGMDLGDERALAPYAIDDATDLLFERRFRPRDAFWLAADNLNALFFGLHDWAHFHNHGPFVERAWTERQCDTAALAWIRLNGVVDNARWSRLVEEIAALDALRFEDEQVKRRRATPGRRPRAAQPAGTASRGRRTRQQ